MFQLQVQLLLEVPNEMPVKTVTALFRSFSVHIYNYTWFNNTKLTI